MCLRTLWLILMTEIFIADVTCHALDSACAGALQALRKMCSDPVSPPPHLASPTERKNSHRSRSWSHDALLQAIRAAAGSVMQDLMNDVMHSGAESPSPPSPSSSSSAKAALADSMQHHQASGSGGLNLAVLDIGECTVT